MRVEFDIDGRHFDVYGSGLDYILERDRGFMVPFISDRVPEDETVLEEYARGILERMEGPLEAGDRVSVGWLEAKVVSRADGDNWILEFEDGDVEDRPRQNILRERRPAAHN